MGGALRKTMVYLGLAEDEERYDAFDGEADVFDDDEADTFDRHLQDRRGDVEHLDEHRGDRAQVTPISRGTVSRMVPASSARSDMQRISTIHPRTYNEAKVIGEAFRSGVPVIMNLGDMDDADAKRLVDFAAGLVFGLHGAIERVTSKVFLLSPANIEVSPAEKVRVPERTFFNQS